MPHMFLRRQTEFDDIRREIHGRMYSLLADLKVEAFCTPEPLSFQKRTEGKRIDILPGVKWGDQMDCAWFHFTGKVPASGKGRPVVLLIDIQGEACVFDKKGNPARGLTHRSSIAWHDTVGKRVVFVSEKAKGGEKIDVWADAGCNDLFGNLVNDGRFKEARIAACNPEMRNLYYDWDVLYTLAVNLPEDSPRRHQIFYALHRAASCLYDYTEDEVKAARKELAGELKKKNGDPDLSVSAVGHAHIDLIWLWPLRETIRKGARTFSTALTLMDRYPDYIFGQSQPQIYDWMKEIYPDLYRRIKTKVAEGRWELQGAMWVEADCNIPSGESLVRQVLYGKRFFKREFGVEVNHLWLADAFGYQASLPQILKRADVDYFLTTKISWNQYTKFPHDTFLWRGIDGSEVFAHFPPANTYNAKLTPDELLRSVGNFK
ncbi:alpha-mannosidase, partial [bacterium]|nr:alpha-mannosidase [bacterium]